MRRLLFLTFLGAALVATACPAERPSYERCTAACEVAARCGLLPSALGGLPGEGDYELFLGCVDRCEGSDLEDMEVERVLECLTIGGQEICAIDSCVDVVTCFHDFFPPGALVEPEVTFRLISGDSWTFLFEPQLCGDLPEDDPYSDICAGDQDPCPLGKGGTVRPPLCTGDNCVYTDNCDPRLCNADFSAAFDCAFMGIEAVRFGWLDVMGGLHLDARTYTCEEAGAGQIVPGIGNQVIYPIALFSGEMSSRVLEVIGAPPTAEGRPYCWFSHPTFPPIGEGEPPPGFEPIGWLVRSGANLITVPSPASAVIVADREDDPTVFPRGCGCLVGDAGCEDPMNSNCANGIDDDEDGLVDDEEPGCAQP